MIHKKWQIKEYSYFPLKRPGDLCIGGLEEKWKNAKYKSIALNRKYKDRRFYAWDVPHEELELDPTQLTTKAKEAIIWENSVTI